MFIRNMSSTSFQLRDAALLTQGRVALATLAFPPACQTHICKSNSLMVWHIE